jgi:hypothetical protein
MTTEPPTEGGYLQEKGKEKEKEKGKEQLKEEDIEKEQLQLVLKKFNL